jgi:predicted  nucleic acid-binding Zn-ribbon protein
MTPEKMVEGSAIVVSGGLGAWIRGLWHRREKRQEDDARVQLSAMQELSQIREEMRKEIEGYRSELDKFREKYDRLREEHREILGKYVALQSEYERLKLEVARISARQDERLKAETPKRKRK